MKISKKDIWFAYEFTAPISLISAYFLTTYIESDEKILIGSLNLYGALLLSYSSYLKENYPTVLLNFFWFGITVAGLSK